MPAGYPQKKILLLAVTFILILLISCKKDNTNAHCEEVVSNLNEFIDYTVNGTAYHYGKPEDTILADTLGESQTFRITSSLFGDRVPAVPGGFIKIIYDSPGTTAGSSQLLNSFYTPQTGLYLIYTVPTSPVLVNITAYGAVGQYIEGNFSGTLTSMPPTSVQYIVTCNFRIKRRI